jgi:flagellar biosynthetic protein FliQ
MIEQYALKVGSEALYLCLLLSAPPVLASLVIGLVISLVQATTQIQDQSLTFVPKLLGVFLAIAITASWMMNKMVIFTNNLFGTFADYIK